MIFKKEIERASIIGNKGLSMGLPSLTRLLGGIQKKTIYSIGALPKVGKTTFVDFSFLLAPFLTNVVKEGKKVKWIYFSYEIDRTRKLFRLAPFFFKRDYGIDTFIHNNHKYPLDSNYLQGKKIDIDNNVILLKDEHKRILYEIYDKYYSKLFGIMDEKGNYIKKGYCDVIEERTNPTGMRNYILNYAKENGKFTFEKYTTIENGKSVTKQRVTGYIPNDKEQFVIIITDHVRKLKNERGYTIKQNIDKWIDYQVELRNLCGYTFVNIAHLNRNIDDIHRIKFMKEFIYPVGSDFKDTGNLSEDSDVVITMFDPRDEKYMLDRHFGINLKDYPNYRSIHIVDSRDTSNGYLQVNFYPATNLLTEIKTN